MRIPKMNKAALCRTLLLLALMMIVVSVFFCAGATRAYAAESPPETETLSVDEVWLTGDVLHIAVTDRNSGGKQTLELNLSDYAKPGDEYVSVQATDGTGRTSNVIQFKNPYYVPSEDKLTPADDGRADGSASQSSIPDGKKPAGDGRPFTPDGTGSVLDNAASGDGKEFFTVETADGNIFYLIVDRQRNAENVYFLNAVTEDDLKSLAKPGDGKSVSAVEIPTPTPAPNPPPATQLTPEPTTAPAPAKSGGNTGTIALVLIAVVLVGGAGYYFKIARPKKNAADDYDDSYDEPDGDEEMELGGDESEVDGE